MAAAAASSTPSALVEVPPATEEEYDVEAAQTHLAQAVWQPQTTTQRNPHHEVHKSWTNKGRGLGDDSYSEDESLISSEGD